METEKESAKTYLLFPSFLKLRFEWYQLPEIFVKPFEYDLESAHGPFATERCVDLGYAVAWKDHDFFTGPAGGGIIRVNWDIGRWFPRCLLNDHCEFKKPVGFGRLDKSGIYVLVPCLRPEHRLQMRPEPAAPAPYFSVEETESERRLIAVALEKQRKTRLTPLFESWPALGVTIRKLANVDMDDAKRLDKLAYRQFEYEWYEMSVENADAHAVLAAFIYLGIELNIRAQFAVRSAHLFAPEFVSGLPFPSATRWASATRKILKASDW
jgi:hypothetical protein